ncbi:MAG: hypothetical protein HQL84_13355, partial [Magnetococcales bacterium]|nr:hypothetical protein [Magnetococcales bacterium]MBF0151021.1 hypothetical protein [Magnetococcales bacterium]
MKSKRWVGLCAAAAFALFASGCGGGGGGGGGDSTSTSTGATGTGATTSGGTTTKTGGLSGTVADGLAMANAKVTVQSATGTTVEVGTTDAS